MENKLKEGEILFADGSIDEAEEFFLSAIEQDANNKEAYNNLGVISIQKEDVKSAIECFTKSLEIDPFYKDAIINYTDLLSTLNQLQIAKPLLEKVVEKYPGDKEITNLLKKAITPDQDQPKIAIICSPNTENFLKDIVEFLETRYEVVKCYTYSIRDIVSAILWSNTVWLEWANELTEQITNYPENILKDKHVICRLHSYEAIDINIKEIKWKNISDLIFVAEHIKDLALQQVPNLFNMVNVHIIPNGINMKKLPYKDRLKGKNLAFLGNINFKKGPMLLLHAIRELVQTDDQYQLFIGGNFQDRRFELYFSQMIRELGLENNIQVDGWIENVDTWLEDKQYIVCTSVLEGHPVGIMEAMTKGLKPLIHNFVGARGIYPDKYLWNTIPDFVRMATEDDYDPAEYIGFIETNYSMEKQLESIDRVISGSCNKGTLNSQSPDINLAELSNCS